MLVSNSIYIDSEHFDLGLSHFVVNVSPECSGLEGMGLALSFSCLYLYLFRKQLPFPKAFVLLPIAAVASWFLNACRIALLIMIGEWVSPEFAIGGFHSQAGWITFTALSLLIVFTFHKFMSVNATEIQEVQRSSEEDSELPLANALIIPFLAFLCISLLSGLDSRTVSFTYFLKVIGTGAALWYWWKTLQLTKPLGRLKAIGIGASVAILWVWMIPADAQYNLSFNTDLEEMGILWGSLWLISRVLGSILIAPLVEELMFRGYLLARLSRQPFGLNQPITATWTAIIISAVAFGAIHQHWIAGCLAGLAYGFVRHRGNVSSAILAHSVTNGLLCVYVLFTLNWTVL
ncbi:hypothetical protein GCM10007877_12610 [Marinibactrum halimedae]|uniref:CAAX prenyl protease 2/Lysostaphin resistance protein A-like domain-containing protein n=2 Tax=Marinibactrum halimedae TaxID=1444977 RepID=A0AA37T637_9GAMM|nr:hypothetical protein GCM10007877_12610 [Marinibactrum halimedae]